MSSHCTGLCKPVQNESSVHTATSVGRGLLGCPTWCGVRGPGSGAGWAGTGNALRLTAPPEAQLTRLWARGFLPAGPASGDALAALWFLGETVTLASIVPSPEPFLDPPVNLLVWEMTIRRLGAPYVIPSERPRQLGPSPEPQGERVHRDLEATREALVLSS